MYYKIITDGYITVFGTGNGGIPITEEEYGSLVSHFRSKPESEDGCGYRLREDLTWELYELPVIPENDEISGDELMSMLEEVL